MNGKAGHGDRAINPAEAEVVRELARTTTGHKKLVDAILAGVPRSR